MKENLTLPERFRTDRMKISFYSDETENSIRKWTKVQRVEKKKERKKDRNRESLWYKKH